jgi:glutathione S-transferase
MALTLVIGNKAYSSWSLRPWLALKVLGIPFREKLIPLYQEGSKAALLAEGGGGTVPILHDGAITVWESLAILDYVDENQGAGRLWPGQKEARAYARSIAAEMHSGFAPLRAHCPMNVRRRREPYALTPEVEANVDRILHLWGSSRARFGAGGPFLFGTFTAADAMHAPVVMRLHFYAIPVPDAARAYMDAVLALPAMQEWLADAAKEPWVLPGNEVY